jgi:hypothetical protein
MHFWNQNCNTNQHEPRLEALKRRISTMATAAKKSSARKSSAKKSTTTKRRSPAPGSKGAKKVEKVMHEHKTGKLKSGSGKKVASRKQAVAIALSEAREAGSKIPKKAKKAKKSSSKK